MLQGHASNNSCKFWKAGFAKLAVGEHAKLQVRLCVFTATKGKCFFLILKIKKWSSLSAKYFVTVATLNVTLFQWQIYGDIFQQRWLNSAHVLL